LKTALNVASLNFFLLSQVLNGETEANYNALVESVRHSDERNQEEQSAAVESSQVFVSRHGQRTFGEGRQGEGAGER
jgi:hypothetical protein